MVKAIKITAVILGAIAVTALSLYLGYLIITKDAVLDREKLHGTFQSVIFTDENGDEITETVSGKLSGVKVENLKDDTVNAFIASEDRTFFSHSGLNYKRMLKALYKNVVSGSFKEGASTISQQLIKNTHLSNDKTISRKLKEIKLTKALEKSYGKNEILEMYLNTIYFGHNCYGLQSAAQFYFDKKAEDLSLTESAAIVGLLTSPNNYSPFKNPDKCLKRRNIVLKNMLDCKFIDKETYETSIALPVNAVQTDKKTAYTDYLEAVFEELDELGLNSYALADGCTIKTYMNRNIQHYIENLPYGCDNAVIITDNESAGVRAYKSTVKGAKRQIGSTAKPLFVYAPAIEERQINTFTKIADEKIDYGGYSPENYDKKYHGLVTVNDAVKYSYNIPSVKVLNALTVEKAEKYISKMGIQLDDDEKNLSLALGGMKYGLSIKELADCYSVFPNGGNFRQSRFIERIETKDGKTIFENENTARKVFGAGTCSLMNEILMDTAKGGTAKKLKNLGFDIAAKTGTCGNSEGNTDAYAVGYTASECMAIWLGDKDNKRMQITGGNQSCDILNEIALYLYAEGQPKKLNTEAGVKTVCLDREDYNEKNLAVLADPLSPKLNLLTVKVLDNNVPSQKSDKFSNPAIVTPSISVLNSAVNIELCQTKYYSYLIKRANNKEIVTVYDGKWQKIIEDTPDGGTYTYTVTPYYETADGKIFGKEIALKPIMIKDDVKKDKIELPDIVNKDWFNL